MVSCTPSRDSFEPGLAEGVGQKVVALARKWEEEEQEEEQEREEEEDNQVVEKVRSKTG